MVIKKNHTVVKQTHFSERALFAENQEKVLDIAAMWPRDVAIGNKDKSVAKHPKYSHLTVREGGDTPTMARNALRAEKYPFQVHRITLSYCKMSNCKSKINELIIRIRTNSQW